MKILFQIKELRTIPDDSYNAEKGATKESYVVINEVDCEITQEVASKVKQAIHKILAEEL